MSLNTIKSTRRECRKEALRYMILLHDAKSKNQQMKLQQIQDSAQQKSNKKQLQSGRKDNLQSGRKFLQTIYQIRY